MAVAQRQRLATAGAAYAFFVTMIGTTFPTPLYPLYERRLHFSSEVATIVFAAYAIGVVAALLLVGQRSDHVGRRPVLLLGLAFAAVSSVVFLVADGLAVLLLGRVLSGLSAGIFTGTATATLVDFAPPEARGRATLVATVVNIGGLGFGSLLAGVLAQLAPDPLRLIYLVHLGVLVPAVVAIWLLPEPVDVHGDRARAWLRLQRLGVPRELRPTFVRAAAAGLAGFALTGLFGGVAPSFLGQVLGEHDLAVIGAVAFTVFAASTVGQAALERISPRSAMPLGCGGMIAGAGLIAAGLAANSLALLVAGAVVGGLGMGLSFRAGLAALNNEAPSERRGEVASSFFVVAYLGLAVPIIGVGLLSQAIGLRAAGLAFTGFVAALSLLVLLSLVGRLRD